MHYPKYFTPIKNPLYLSIHNSLSPSLANTIKIRDSSCQTVLPPGVISSRHDKEGDNRSSVKVLSSETSRQTQANFSPLPPLPSPRRGRKDINVSGSLACIKLSGIFRVRAQHVDASFSPPPFNPG